MAVELNASNFKNEVLESAIPVIIKAYASWCGPCIHMEPVYHEAEKMYAGRAHFTQLNVDQARDLAIQLGVTSIPTIIFVRDGQIVGRETGYMDKSDLVAKLDQLFA